MSACEVEESFPARKSVTIQLPEHFDYRSIHSFKRVYQRGLVDTSEVVVDMAFTRYIDSSGIALLLCLFQWLGHPASVIRITHCRPSIRQILALAKCEGRFAFE
jgi:anti-anti-sigma regulatory factor